MPPAADNSRNLTGGAWLLADMSLNIWALAIAKSLGHDYPAFQIVFLRAVVGLILILPWALRRRNDFRDLSTLPLHLLRVALSALALTSSFYAIARVPIALFTTVNFMRPLLLMVMAALFLHELISVRRWIAAFIGLIGVMVAINPSELAGGWGLPALFLTVIAGSSAVIVTRKIPFVPTVVMMTFYTAGMAVLIGPWALFHWQPVALHHWPALLVIGVFAQSAQFCFLRAHRLGQAAFLAILSYASLMLSTSVGYFVFNEVPRASFWVGAMIIIAATLWVTLKKEPEIKAKY